MTGITYAQLCALSDAAQITDERIAIIVIDGGLSEDEARAIINQEQIALNFERG